MKNEQLNNTTRSIKYNSIEENPNIQNEEYEKDNKEKNTILKKIVISVILILIFIIAYSCFISPYIFETKEYKLESSLLPNSFHGLKIIHFSDIHYGTTINQKELDKIVKKINDLNPDIIFFTGDLIDRNISPNETIEQEIVESLKKLKCQLYKYAIYGNEDLINTKYKDLLNEADFQVLDNESTLLYYKDTTPIMITGFNSLETSPNYTILTNNINDQDPSNFYKIVLTHEPDSYEKIKTYKPNLILSGHSLGGLIKLPFLKPVFLNEGAKAYYEDYYQFDTTELYISSGLGTSGINARFNNNPSINLYRLYVKKD